MLTKDQQEAFNSIFQFIADPNEHVFVLEGYAGTGKSYLVSKVLENIPKYFATQTLINPEYVEMVVELTATTNKAAEALQEQVHQPVKTIFSLLGLVVRTDYETNSKSLGVKRGTLKVYNSIVFIDEASYADGQLISYVFSQTEKCKIIFIGDPAQLSMSYGTAPVFTQG